MLISEERPTKGSLCSYPYQSNGDRDNGIAEWVKADRSVENTVRTITPFLYYHFSLLAIRSDAMNDSLQCQVKANNDQI